MEQMALRTSLTNPFVSRQDTEAGARLFQERCATCHGNKGEGWHAPSLVSGLKHGNSSLSVYRVIRDGIPGTIMKAQDLSSRERWQIVGFLRMLRASGPKWIRDHSGYPKIAVNAKDISNAGGTTDTWPTYSGSLDGSRYSKLSEINSDNVSRLRIRWVAQFTTTEILFPSHAACCT